MKMGIRVRRADRAVTSLACSQTAEEVKAEGNFFLQKKDEVWRMSDRPGGGRSQGGNGRTECSRQGLACRCRGSAVTGEAGQVVQAQGGEAATPDTAGIQAQIGVPIYQAHG